MAERAISIRLDADARRALEFLMRKGKSRSEAIRDALTTVARQDLYEQAATDAARIAADEADRREVVAIQELMEEMRAEG